MINLSLQKTKFYEMIWIDGTKVRMKAPSQKLYKMITELQDTTNVDDIYNLTQEILNTALGGKQLSINELTLDSCALIIEDYFSFWTKQLEEVVFHQSQQMNQ